MVTSDAMPSATTRSFVYKDEKTEKFWNITVSGNAYTVRFGKVGAVGQSKEKTFADAASCAAEAAKAIAEKSRKGYVEQD